MENQELVLYGFDIFLCQNVQLHDKLNEAIDRALKSRARVSHKLKIPRPSVRRRRKPVFLLPRTPLTEDACKGPRDMNRLQVELSNHFEYYATPVQERSDLLRILSHPQAKLDDVNYCSAKGLQNHVEKDGFCDKPLEANMWKGTFLSKT